MSENDKKHIQDEINEDAFAATKATLAYHQQCQEERQQKSEIDPLSKTHFANRSDRLGGFGARGSVPVSQHSKTQYS